MQVVPSYSPLFERRRASVAARIASRSGTEFDLARAVPEAVPVVRPRAPSGHHDEGHQLEGLGSGALAV